MERGDLIILKGADGIGLIVYKHPTKGVAHVYWSDVGFNWESTSRLTLIATGSIKNK